MLLIGLAWGFPTLGLDTSTPGEGQLPLSGGFDGKTRLSQAPVTKEDPTHCHPQHQEGAAMRTGLRVQMGPEGGWYRPRLERHSPPRPRKSCSLQFICLSTHPYPFSLYLKSCCLVANSCLTLCNPMDCSPPGFSVHGIS